MIIHERNYLDIYPFDKWETNILPQFSLNEELRLETLLLKESKTNPPEMLSEADLINLMDKNGIGTDATIHEHIKKIIDRHYVYKRRYRFYPSNLGVGLIEGYDAMGLETSLGKPALRRQVELDLQRICAGELEKQQMIERHVERYAQMFSQVLNQVIKLDEVLLFPLILRDSPSSSSSSFFSLGSY